MYAPFKDELIHELVFLPSGAALVRYDGRGQSQGVNAIGMVAHAGAPVEPVTRDTNHYHTLTVSADGKAAVTVQRHSTFTASLVSGAGANPVARAVPQAQRPHVVAFTRDGKLLTANNQSISRVEDSGPPAVLLSDPAAWLPDMNTCGERYLVFAWGYHAGSTAMRIWRANLDGTNPQVLSDGTFDFMPTCSPDGKWAYYYSSDDRLHAVKRVLLEGGSAPEMVPGSDVDRMYGIGAGIAASPDGKLLVFGADISSANSAGALTRLAVVELDGSQKAPRLLEPDRRISGGPEDSFTNTMAFTPDGKAVTYVVRDKGVDNVWAQPLDGGARKQLTNFTSDHILKFAWSPDGKTLAVSQIHTVADVVLLQEK
jgi:WD40 repeat protein